MTTAPPRFTRSTSFLLVLVAYVAAGGAAAVVAAFLGHAHPIRAAFLADVVATFVVFGFSKELDNSSVYDPYWSVVPIVIGAYWAAVGGSDAVPAFRQGLVLLLVALWGARLTWNWARGWPGLHHQDWRYVDLQERHGPRYWTVSLSGIHLMPTVLVFLGCLPLWAVVTGVRRFGLLDLLALVVTAGAIVLETVADEQLRRFNARKQPGEICAEGLWSRSRHPNYLGEMGFWWGLWLFGVAARPGALWWTAIGPVAITLMFRFASIPMLDERSRARRPGYEEHEARVPAVVPRLRS
jgi:steroid 5-alpha reductase family enzyme